NDAALRVASLIKGAGLEPGRIRAGFIEACRTLSNEPGQRGWTERDFTMKWDRAHAAARPRDLSHVGLVSDIGAGMNGHRFNGRAGNGPAAAPGTPSDEPLPLYPPLPPAESYPVDALGP